MAIKFSPRLAALALVVSHALHACAYVEYPVGVVSTEAYGALNFSEIFSSAHGLGGTDDKSNMAWTRSAFNGLTTFAHAPPVRCFGADAERGYDVAVLGAPFDTATSFRPG